MERKEQGNEKNMEVNGMKGEKGKDMEMEWKGNANEMERTDAIKSWNELFLSIALHFSRFFPFHIPSISLLLHLFSRRSQGQPGPKTYLFRDFPLKFQFPFHFRSIPFRSAQGQPEPKRCLFRVKDFEATRFISIFLTCFSISFFHVSFMPFHVQFSSNPCLSFNSFSLRKYIFLFPYLFHFCISISFQVSFNLVPCPFLSFPSYPPLSICFHELPKTSPGRKSVRLAISRVTYLEAMSFVPFPFQFKGCFHFFLLSFHMRLSVFIFFIFCIPCCSFLGFFITSRK